MYDSQHRRQARWATAIAVCAAIVAIITTIIPDWIEAVFGVDPDGGNGSLEWAIPLTLGLIAIIAALSGIRYLRLSRA